MQLTTSLIFSIYTPKHHCHPTTQGRFSFISHTTHAFTSTSNPSSHKIPFENTSAHTHTHATSLINNPQRTITIPLPQYPLQRLRRPHSSRSPALTAQLTRLDFRLPSVGDLLLSGRFFWVAKPLLDSTAEGAAEGLAGALMYVTMFCQ